jgi:predicted RNase H-like HicB family nuclease
MKYTITIQWSQEDDCYVVYLPEFKDVTNQPATHGETYEEALAHALEVLEMLTEELLAEGKELPALPAMVS